MLFDEIDKEITKQNVDWLLSRYHSIKRLAGSHNQKMTSTYTFMPRSYTGETSDPVAEAVTNRIKARQQLKEIEQAINCLSGNARKRIYFKYLVEDMYYDYQIYNGENISEATYYRELGKAQIEFAEAYKGGALLAFEIE